jgi:hypothetical protein
MAVEINSESPQGRRDFQDHLGRVARALKGGRVVPFLGAGVNLCIENGVWPLGGTAAPAPSDVSAGGVPNGPTRARRSRLPSGGELAEYLAKKFKYPSAPAGCTVAGCTTLDLARVSQYGVTMEDEGPLYDYLAGAFEGVYSPTLVHTFLAELPPAKTKAPEDSRPLFVTTNYDDLLERAIGEGNFDLVYFDPAMPIDPRFPQLTRPGFWHQEAGGELKAIESASDYPYPFFENRAAVLKIHGTLGPASGRRSGVVITEDDYIEYLAKAPLETLLPRRLLEKMRANHHLLFLGYSLRDWNFRVFLRGLKRTPQETYRGWAVLKAAEQADAKFWEKSGIDVVVGDLAEYISKLQDALQAELAHA